MESVTNDHYVTNVELNIFCQPSGYAKAMADLRKASTPAIADSILQQRKLETLAEQLATLEVALPAGCDYHVFLAHDWGNDEQGRNNHMRVARVNWYLKERGLLTWFDEERLHGDIEEAMCDGIDRAAVTLVFLTKRYARKV